MFRTGVSSCSGDKWRASRKSSQRDRVRSSVMVSACTINISQHEGARPVGDSFLSNARLELHCPAKITRTCLPGRSLLLICLTFIYLTFIPSVTLVQSVIAGPKEKTGRSLEEWVTLVKKEGPAEH